MTESKKTWIEPELIVLTRSKPEEAVLGGCKGGISEGPSNDSGICMLDCAFCSEYTFS
jgi:hypothetical protein